MPRVWALVDNATGMLRALYADETAACRENIALGWICTVQSWAVTDGEELAGTRTTIVDLAEAVATARPCVYCQADNAPPRELRRVREDGTVDRNRVYVCQACIADGPGVDVLARLLQERIDAMDAR